MLCDRVRVLPWRVRDEHAVPGRGVDVNVVHASAVLHHDRQRVRGVEERGRQRNRARDDSVEPVGIGDERRLVRVLVDRDERREVAEFVGAARVNG